MHDFTLLTNLSVCFGAALALGLITQRLGLSPILGYLLTGVLLGPRTPGFVADAGMAAQFAELGVILLMFGVGLHFHLDDLLKVRRVAIPGAILQIVAATILGMIVGALHGKGVGSGLVLGVAVSVASTVVLIRVLTDNNLLQSVQGNIAVGWLIVEDIFTVFVLVMLPGMAGMLGGVSQSDSGLLFALVLATGKILTLVGLVFFVGRRLVPWLLKQVARSRSRELFTLAVLALALGIATAAGSLLGVSMALGAFLAGMVVGQTEVSHQAAADALPMKDAFAVLFFVAVGMLFDPSAVMERPMYLLSLLGIVLIAKPLVAFGLVWALGYSVRTALIVSVGLAQIGEFSFILADLGTKLDIVSHYGQSLLVSCALVSITLNPVLFKAIDPVDRWLRRNPTLWKLLNRRTQALEATVNQTPVTLSEDATVTAIVVGYGPVGRTACRILREFEVQPVIIDMNLDTIRALQESGVPAVYGNASQRAILENARIDSARFLLITAPDQSVQTEVAHTARDIKADLRIFARSRYIQDSEWLRAAGANVVCSEEAMVAAGMAMELLREMNASEDRIQAEIRRANEFDTGAARPEPETKTKTTE